jgi:type VI secretion system protein ImpK
MREAIASLVCSVLDRGLALREQLRGGAALDLDREQAVLRDLLMTEHDARQLADYGGERPRARPADRPAAAAGAEEFLGVRYALVCWLDELFTGDPVWGPQWNERKLEMELYGSNDRAWKFWQQARLAQARPETDALEGYYLCALLGFRGELRDQPEQLHTWVASAKARLGQVREFEWPDAAEQDPSTWVPPLRGRERLRRMVLTSWVVFLLMIPVMAFLLVHRLSQ